MKSYLVHFSGYMICDAEGEREATESEISDFLMQHVSKLNPSAVISEVVVLEEGLRRHIRMIQASNLGVKFN